MTLSGLGSAKFKDAVSAILKIHQYFQQHCPEGQMDGWEPRKERGYPVVSAGARYLSTKANTSSEQVIPLSEVIDPIGILARAVPGGLHTQENQVLYFERVAKAG